MTSMTTVTTLSTATPISKLMSSMSFLGAPFRNSSYTIKGVLPEPAFTKYSLSEEQKRTAYVIKIRFENG